MKRDLNELASRISLEDFAKSEFGYKTDHEKTSRRWPTLVKDDERIIIGNGKDGDFYYNVNDPSDKGNAVKFAFNRSNNWKDTFERIDKYLEQPHTISRDNRMIEVSEDRHIALSRDFQLKELKDRKYLHERGISDETIDSKSFKNRVFNKTFDLKEHTNKLIEEKFPSGSSKELHNKAIDLANAKNYSGDYISTIKSFNSQQSPLTDSEKIERLSITKAHFDKSDDRKIVNTAFPLNSEDGTIGLIVRNKNLKEIDGFRDIGLWSSSHVEAPKSIIITESPIDSLSHYQLHKPEKAIYYSTGGSPSSNQPIILQNEIYQLKPEKVVLANDNDLGGVKSNIQILDKLEGKRNDLELGLVTNEKYSALAILKSQNIDEAAARLENTLNQCDDFKVAQARRTGDTTAEIQFPKKIEYFQKIEEHLIREKGLENQVVIHRPFGKDFNEDLQNSRPFSLIKEKDDHRELIGKYALASEAKEAIERQNTLGKEDSNNKLLLVTSYMGREIRLAEAGPDKKIQFDKGFENDAITQKIEAAKSNVKNGDMLVVDKQENNLARTDYKVETDSKGHVEIKRETNYDQEQLTRHRTDGKDIQTSINKDVNEAISGKKGSVDLDNQQYKKDKGMGL
jgi:hypothetical protein